MVVEQQVRGPGSRLRAQPSPTAFRSGNADAGSHSVNGHRFYPTAATKFPTEAASTRPAQATFGVAIRGVRLQHRRLRSMKDQQPEPGRELFSLTELDCVRASPRSTVTAENTFALARDVTSLPDLSTGLTPSTEKRPDAKLGELLGES